MCKLYVWQTYMATHMSDHMLTYMQNIGKPDIMLICATHYVYKYVFAALDRVSALLHGPYSVVNELCCPWPGVSSSLGPC